MSPALQILIETLMYFYLLFILLAAIVHIKYLYHYICHYMAFSYGMYPTDTVINNFSVNWSEAIRRIFSLQFSLETQD